ncbi:MAG: U32 family peptidase [Deltaproteobacteria bacterium]|nr:MAG: U32 family peptidase [Deltaproteobacteria bacterium]
MSTANTDTHTTGAPFIVIPQKLELLSPAKNKEYGMAAISHGADAVYIGADRFGARSAAGNPVSEIEELAAYAHLYKAKVYIALNTILFDNELVDAEKLIYRLWNAGADALIIQDMGLLEMDLPPIPLFASTQVNNQTVARVQFLEASGFERVILARELGIHQIEEISQSTTLALEAFVHGAVCACYSGQCYFSAAIGNRSANRGECGQPCRLPWNLISQTDQGLGTVQGCETGRVLEKERHLLSLKDMNRSDHLGRLAAAGITSFKIEGRLKDLAYVKNITAFYRQKLDFLMTTGSVYGPASSGRTTFSFVPDSLKTFNRGETDYFLFGRKGEIHSFDTPKSLGEKIGLVDRIDTGYLTLKTSHDIQNGDGLCYMDQRGRLQGFQVNSTDQGKIYTSGRLNLKKSPLFPGALIYRNHDHLFLKKLGGASAQRRIGLDLSFHETAEGFVLKGQDEDENWIEVRLDMEKIFAQNEPAALAALKKQLGKLGASIFYLRQLTLHSKPYFIPTRELNQIRRALLERMTLKRAEAYQRVAAISRPLPAPYPEIQVDFTANVSNEKAIEFYRKRGVSRVDAAFELSPPGPGTVVMTLRHCIRQALGACPKETTSSAGVWGDPLFLENKKGRFQLVFDCKRCQMKILTL